MKKLIILVLIALLVLMAATACSSKATEEAVPPATAATEQNLNTPATAPAATTTPNPATTPAETPSKSSNGHIIPEITPPPVTTPEPEVLNYVYNPVEYYLAIKDKSLITGKYMYCAWDRQELKDYNLTEKQVADFREKHTINPGDQVLVRAKVKKVNLSESDKYASINFETPTSLEAVWIPWTIPDWVPDLQKRVKAGEKLTILIRAVAKNYTAVMNAELIKIEQ